MKKAPNLSEAEVQYFYNLLYLLERVTKYKGFNISRMDSTVRKAINLNSNYLETESIPKPSGNNSINYAGKYGKAKYLFKHIRNSFAHGLLESRGNEFYLLDVPKGKENEKDLEKYATMIGSMDKTVFYEMVKAILNTNQLTKNFS